MALYSAIQKFITKNGAPVAGASCLVLVDGSTTEPTLYAGRAGGSLANPFPTDAQGNALCYVSPGRYKMIVTKDAEQVTFEGIEVGPVSLTGTFSAGGLVSDPDQWFTDQYNNQWAWTGSLNKTVAPGEDPNAVEGWVLMLEGDNEPSKPQALSFAAGGVVKRPFNSIEDEDGNEWRWAGSLPKTVVPGTDPASDPLYVATGITLLALEGSTALIAAVEARKLAESYRQIIYVKNYGISGTGNETVAFNAVLALTGVIDLCGLSITVDYVTLHSNTTIKNGKILLTNALVSSIENPLITGANYVRGINSPVNYPAETLVNVRFQDLTIRNVAMSTYRKGVVGFYNVDGLTFKKVKFENIYGHAVRVFGDYVGFTPNTTIYDIPVPISYSKNIRIIDCKFEDGFYYDGASDLQLGAAVQLVACQGAELSGNKARNCIAGYLIDFLNIDIEVSRNKYKITMPEIYENIANYQDVVGIYCGQATQNVDVIRNDIDGASRIGFYIESASGINGRNNRIKAWPSATGDTGIFQLANALSEGAPFLACVKNRLESNNIEGFETSLVAGSTEAGSLIDGGFIAKNALRNRAGSSQPSLVLTNCNDLSIESNSGNAALQILNVSDSAINLNYIKSSGQAFVVKAGTYNNLSGTGNSFISTTTSPVSAEVITGNINFKGGLLQGVGALLSGTFTAGLTFTDYSNQAPNYKVFTQELSIPADSTAGFNTTVTGARAGDIVTATVVNPALPNLTASAFVESANNVFVRVFNSGADTGVINVPLYVTAVTFANSDYRKG